MADKHPITVTAETTGVLYRGGDRWARVVLRDSPWCSRHTCWDVEFSDRTRFGGEMPFGFVDSRCLAWVARGER
jgi:hypothetical protein